MAPRTPLPTLLASVLLVLAWMGPAHGAGYAVVGGSPVQDGEWPSTVALVRAEVEDDVAGQVCAGTAIGPDLVLTAAHCFHDAAGSTWRQPGALRVVAGRTDLSAEGGVERAGVEVWVHPAYDQRRRRHDVAVLRVDGPLGVPQQPLASEGAAGPFEADPAVVLGWGRTGPSDEQASSRTAVLHRGDVPVSSEQVCREAFDGSLDLRAHLCAGGDGTAEAPQPDACRGDSGGPLLVRDPDGTWVQHGITSFGPWRCGVDEPGVYTRMTTVRPFVDEVRSGALPPTALPAGDPARTAGVRVAAQPDGPTTPIAQAVAASQAVFADGTAELAVVARDDAFADALAGSALGYGRGPLLFTPSSGGLDPATRAELQRAVPTGTTVYLLGGPAAVPEAAAEELAALGYDPVRLAGAARESTAVAVAEEVIRRHGTGDRPAYGTAIVVTAQSWPDAVVAGQLGVWWGFPVLLTGPDALHPAAEAALAGMAAGRVLVVGGEGAVGPAVVDRLAGLVGDGGEVRRLAGADRVATALEVAGWHRAELAATGQAPPDAVVAVNVRAEGAYAHMLSATPLLGATAGAFLPVEGEGGDVLRADVREAMCGAGGMGLVIGGTDLIAPAVADALPGLLDGTAC